MSKWMSMLVVLLFMSSLLARGADALCGPSACYPSSCAKSATPASVDFVFAVDTSGSMVHAISGVQQGCVEFVTSAANLGISALFSLVVFSKPWVDPTLELQLTDSASAFINQINLISPYSLTGWRETGLETMRCIAQKCNKDNMNIDYRPYAKRVLMFFTDEDSDPPNYGANSVGFEQAIENDRWCPPYSLTGNPLPPGDDLDLNYQTSYISETEWPLWQNEIDATAQILIEQEWSVYLNLNNHDNTCLTCLNFVQYGNPLLDVHQPDYSGWDPAKTLNNLQASYSKGSLQAQLIQQGLVARSFYVYDAADPNVVKNLFVSVANDLVVQCDSCLAYNCTALGSSQCVTPVYMCDCARQPALPSGAFAHTLDPNGVCCNTSAVDCAGFCYGTNSVKNNACGICSPPGYFSYECAKDCAGNSYLTGPPSGAIFDPIAPPISPAGYLIAPGNNDLLKQALSFFNASNNFVNFGRFQGRYYCTLNYVAFSANVGANCVGFACEAVFFANIQNIISGVWTAECLPGSLQKLPPYITDNCGQCVTNSSNPPQCVKDCTGTYKGVGQAVLTYDDCGICGGNNNASEFDSCGVCKNAGGNNAEKDHCGNCPPYTPVGKAAANNNFQLGVDGCGNYYCNASRPVCGVMCNGKNGTAPFAFGYDVCGDCVALQNGTGINGIAAVYPNATGCVQQCDGTFYNPNAIGNALDRTQPPKKITDQCGNCYVSGSSPPPCAVDCHGVYNGNAYVDQCGQCVGDGLASVACVPDCAGVYYLVGSTPQYATNACGLCRVNNATGANQDFDHCGQCANYNATAIGLNFTSTYNSTAQCLLDCLGTTWYLVGSTTPHAVIDQCGNCIPPYNLSLYNADRDACGVCYPGGASNASFNSEIQFDHFLNVSCGCNAQFLPCPAYNGQLICGDCPNIQDSCGRYITSPYFNYYDDCMNCCSSNNGTCCLNGQNCPLPSPAEDLCGRCPAAIVASSTPAITTEAQLKALPCGVCPGTPFYVDCAGVCNGTSVYDCSGVCQGKCNNCSASGLCMAACGNGIVEPGEQCDDGSSNGADGVCSINCQLVAQSDLAAIVGGTVGGVAALGFVALVGVLLVQYARYHGLFGFGNRKADMGGASSNPLYSPQDIIADNPLYEAV